MSTTSAARVAAAAQLRRLSHAFVSHQMDDATLEALTARVAALIDVVEAAPERTHTFLEFGADLFAERMKGDGPSRDSVFPDCFVSGRASPVGMDARIWLEDREALLEVTLGPAFEGAPGRAHGGVPAALIDETMGLVLSVAGTPAFTGRLTVTYRAPTPLGVLITGRARITQRTGRKITITCELHSEGVLLAESEGLFIAVDAAHFLGTP
ncbi:MAG TPA: PaaI family thioesterase [Acidimicrobiales bacterium]|jgi:acyl-coenzyme A thioesterase PaaI-like protein|nr:PaaI family thioesterase [Acidimicrobiales bacterium]